MPGRCDICNSICQGCLCDAHTQALQERPDENPAALERYTSAGLRRLGVCLDNHQRFAAWLREHENLSTIGGDMNPFDHRKLNDGNGNRIPFIQNTQPDQDGKFWVTAFPGPFKDDENLQGPACPLLVGDGTGKYEVS